jgi:hypothetical protein
MWKELTKKVVGFACGEKNSTGTTTTTTMVQQRQWYNNNNNVDRTKSTTKYGSTKQRMVQLLFDDLKALSTATSWVEKAITATTNTKQKPKEKCLWQEDNNSTIAPQM